MPGTSAWGSIRAIPIAHAQFLELCHNAGQLRPTPLLLQYVEGDYNCLHQDLYGDLAFPLQVAILLSEPDRDFTAANSSSPSSDRACSPGPRSCRSGKATASPLPSTTGP